MALEPGRQLAKGAVRVHHLGLELGFMGGSEVEQAGAIGYVAAESLVLVRHHLGDPVELDIEGAELLVLTRDLAAYGRRVLDDPG